MAARHGAFERNANILQQQRTILVERIATKIIVDIIRVCRQLHEDVRISPRVDSTDDEKRGALVGFERLVLSAFNLTL